LGELFCVCVCVYILKIWQLAHSFVCLIDSDKLQWINLFCNLIAVNTVWTVHCVCVEQISFGLEDWIDVYIYVWCIFGVCQFGGTEHFLSRQFTSL
jgi:hypothetical protein